MVTFPAAAQQQCATPAEMHVVCDQIAAIGESTADCAGWSPATEGVLPCTEEARFGRPTVTQNSCPEFGTFEYPFGGNTAQYRPIGSGARYAGDGDPTTRSLRSVGFGHLNSPGSSGYGFSVWRKGDQASAPKGAEGVVIIVDGNTAYEYWHYHGGDSADAKFTWSMDGRPEPQGGKRVGASASGVAGLFGLARGHELNTPGTPIRHVSQITLAKSLATPVAVWPAAGVDGYCKRGECGGTIKYGSLLALPPAVNVDGLGLSEPGRRLAHALQDFGAYVVDTTKGNSTNMRADQYVSPAIVQKVSQDMGKVYPLLRVITNNSQDQTTSGGGAPRDQVCKTK
ncbi:hypothetical protein UFOVP1244_89 [uncultured Caudovirales phage]|uniref:Uncharacterized protein n=1 Tax=uncultured Caudovirales phage TaxID=2100421 RepID=A0A6J5R772_9CAUD|nr:hypothetical protein UFOVP1244_89 [uncultured Caudovirales phage]